MANTKQDNAGKVALITGSTRGIGLAIAEEFAANGYTIVLNGTKNGSKGGNKLAKNMAAKYDVPVFYVQANMEKEKQEEQGGGQIVFVTSEQAIVHSPNKAAYVGAKAGLEAVKNVAAKENKDKNITVNTVAPWFVATDLVTDQIAAVATEKKITIDEAKKRLNITDMLTVEEVGKATYKLVESNKTGITLRMRAGEENKWIDGLKPAA